MIAAGSFGISTQLVRADRLSPAPLLAIAAHGFRSVELYAARDHFDYRNSNSVADLQQWLAAAALELTSVHAPTLVSPDGEDRDTLIDLGSPDGDVREFAVAEVEQALFVARRIAFKTLVVHLSAVSRSSGPGSYSRDGARRSLETLAASAAPLGVRLAIEVLPAEHSHPGALVHFIEDVLDVSDVGICLDLGHAHIHGDVIDAVETVAEHLIAVDLHDNHRRADDHLVPFGGNMPWAEVMMSLLKVGYEGPLTFELNGARGGLTQILERASKARERLGNLVTW